LKTDLHRHCDKVEHQITDTKSSKERSNIIESTAVVHKVRMDGHRQRTGILFFLFLGSIVVPTLDQ